MVGHYHSEEADLSPPCDPVFVRTEELNSHRILIDIAGHQSGDYRTSMNASSWTIAEGIRYLLAGFATMAVCWGAYVGLIELAGIHYLLSANIATLVAWGFAYLVHRGFVFRAQVAHVRAGPRFVALQLSLLGLANVLLFLGVGMLGIHYFVAVVVVSIVTAVLNYTLMKLIVFSPPKSSGVEAPP